ncbi:uncharacterized protein TM35_000074810 [Trypanosoma theileri]|uniref:Uncharacterized protein n=1 Tax=Trypanosoma theileri TaxID=67003 RepID=A0A1X0P2A3_9TRYP|nr:uncharacterized protein TM35_000074810 [Trypanosoma theileri]ORC91057.1 hypothetical protein TM35_000074810 [Trypanosoma theileri]
MQYLYDDVIPPFRFFSKIVMRCVNDALDEATASRQSKGEKNTETFGTTIAADAPPSVVVSAVEVERNALYSYQYESTNTRRSSSNRRFLTAVSIDYSITLCGFSDGRVTLTQGTHTNGVCETVEVPILDGFQYGQVVTLSCTPQSETQWAVAVGYSKVVCVCLVSILKDNYYGLASRRKVRQRVVELNLSEWASGASLSSLQLSPCLSYLTVGFNNDALINIAQLPPLEVPRAAQDDELERFQLGIANRLLEEGSHTSNRRGKMFFIPETAQGHLHTVFMSAASQTSCSAMYSRRYPISLLVWLDGNSYTRCSLSIISKSDRIRPGTSDELKLLIGASTSKKLSGISSASLSEHPIGSPGTRRKSIGRGRPETAGLKKKELDSKIGLSTSFEDQFQFGKAIQKCLLPDNIVTASIASADSEVVAVGCSNGKVYLMDGRGITSVLSMLPPYGKSMRLHSLFPFPIGCRSTAVQTVVATLIGGGSIILAHASGVPKAAFTNWATTHYLRDVRDLRALIPLGDLSMFLLFCDADVYLWDVHYNCVVAKITGLPPLEPFTLERNSGRKTSSTTATTTTVSSSRRRSTKAGGSLRTNNSINACRDVYLPYSTELAIFWRTTYGGLARLFIKDLISQVYPLLGVYFPSLPLRTLDWVLNQVPPHQRHTAECLAAVALPAEGHLAALDETSGGNHSAEMSPFTQSVFPPLREPKRPLNPEDVAANFLEATCSSVTTRRTEIRRMFGSSWTQCS